ncbi:hypothetical protein F9278_12890 [Streptomyces phaeolivaceus]|uniref:Uncharacterized protein n=1 Tax=Streptomyces phaeolivaceus TaxID=2653200 RepID=A0A5P8K1F3_9ACTN|nr:hypothetical protein [Streptomyces phaeolivaceus]QFQ96961.1 hypothetical protein F9278_12890 [Streptomyces phaeolivaceus]
MTDVRNRQPPPPRAELPMLRAYRLWFEHTRKCTAGCKGNPRAQDGCDDGRQFWGTYRLARIGKTTTP